jgi:hypothetical protein
MIENNTTTVSGTSFSLKYFLLQYFSSNYYDTNGFFFNNDTVACRAVAMQQPQNEWKKRFPVARAEVL